MKNKILNIIFFVFCVILLVYVSFPPPEFPTPPEAALQSNEPGDMESSLRRAYYTNLTRQEVIAHYESQFNQMNFVPTLRLNYPPEEAQVVIRDQTKSTYLEELVHPMRESLYISGFEAKNTIYELNSGGELWEQKITVKYVPSSIYWRILVVVLTLASIYLLVRQYQYVKEK